MFYDSFAMQNYLNIIVRAMVLLLSLLLNNMLMTFYSLLQYTFNY